jgi:hypothetical protein
MKYNERLDADKQISWEEKIAGLIRAAIEESEDSDGKPDFTLTDEDCQDLGKQILKEVLVEFRPDLLA